MASLDFPTAVGPAITMTFTGLGFVIMLDSSAKLCMLVIPRLTLRILDEIGKLRAS